MSRPNQDPNDSSRTTPLSPDSHVADEFLLFSIDDELSAADAEIVNAHVAVCWSCRARKERFEKSVRSVVEYRNARTDPYLPPPQAGPAILRARLDQQAAELGNPALFRRWSADLMSLVGRPATSRFAWSVITATLVVCGVVSIHLFLTRGIAVVSAAELLHKAQQQEAKVLGGDGKPVVRQRVRIEVNGKAVMRTIYRDPNGKRRAAKVEVDASQETNTETVFRASSFDWDDPLSPARYNEWREGLGERRDHVLSVGAELLMLRTASSQGPVAEASLTVRSSDYHPVAESIQLRDSSRIEIAELSYEIVGLDALEPAVFGNPLGVPTSQLRLPSNLPSSALRGPTVMESAAAEVEVRAALHRIGADLGEQIEIEDTPTGRVMVNALAIDDARKREIGSALAGIPLTQISVRTIAEANAGEQSAIPASRGRITARSVDSTPLLDKQLRERFTATDERAGFVNQSLALAQGASARAWALRRLADRYTPGELALLDRGSRQRLEELLSDHVGALQQDISRLRNQLGVVMSPSSNTAAANTSAAEATALPHKEAQLQLGDWRADVRRVHSSVETVNECAAALLGGATSAGEDADKVELRLRTTLTELQAELETLGHQVHAQL